MKVRTRIAPSPTGIPHIGNTRTALFNYLFARKMGGQFILRIEDTDQARKVEGAEKAIEDILSWLGLHFDEKYIQSERLQLYKKAAEEFVRQGLAYKDEGAIRFRMPQEGITEWTDVIGNKKISFENKNQEDFVILKSDGFPTYHLANVIDDHDMKISHVIRGDEWISSTPKHLQLYKAFGWEPPLFAHLPVILGNDRSKLSKRHGADSVLDFRQKGFLKEALVNFMALLGWSPTGSDEGKEVFTLSELEQLFDLKDVNTNAPVFDLQKLEWLDSVWMRKLSDENKEELKKRLEEFYRTDAEVASILKTQEADALLSLASSRMKTLADFKTLVFPPAMPVQFSEEEKALAEKLASALEKFENWESDALLLFLKTFQKENNTSMKTIYKIIMGREQGLPMIDWMQMQGGEKILRQLRSL